MRAIDDRSDTETQEGLSEGIQRVGNVWEEADSFTRLDLLRLAPHPSDDLQEADSSTCPKPDRDLGWRLRFEKYLHRNGNQSFVSA